LSAGQFLNVAADSHIVIEAVNSNSVVQIQQQSTRLPAVSARAGFGKPLGANPVAC
jgi:hypothetical protein